MQVEHFIQSEEFRFAHKLLGQLAEQLGVLGEDMIGDLLELLIHLTLGFGGRWRRAAINELLHLRLLGCGQLLEFFNHFYGAHGSKVLLRGIAGKLRFKAAARLSLAPWL